MQQPDILFLLLYCGFCLFVVVTISQRRKRTASDLTTLPQDLRDEDRKQFCVDRRDDLFRLFSSEFREAERTSRKLRTLGLCILMFFGGFMFYVMPLPLMGLRI